MRYQHKCYILPVLIVFGIFMSKAVLASTVRRTVVVAVDCSPSFQKDPNKGLLYDELSGLLRGDADKIKNLGRTLRKEADGNVPFFNPQTDALSLYMFSMPGKNRAAIMDNFFIRHRWVEEDGFANYFAHQFIFHVADYLPGDDASRFDAFVNDNLKSLFDDCPIIRDYNTNSGSPGTKTAPITLSHYVYPLIMAVSAPTDYSTEYVMLVLTDYKSGTAEGDGDDLNRIREIVGEQNLNNTNTQAFSNMVDDISQGFYRVDYFKAIRSGLTMKAFKIRPKVGVSTEDATLQVESDMNLRQTSWGEDEFEIRTPILLRFDHADSFAIDSLMLHVLDDNGEVIGSSQIPVEASTGKDLAIDELSLQLEGITSPDDFEHLQFCFSILGRYSYQDITMPLRYEATRTLLPENIEFKNPLILVLIKMIVLLLLLLGVLAVLYIMIQRGKRKVLTVELDSSQFQNGPFQKVGKGGAQFLNCNFVPKGNSKISCYLKGRIQNEVGFCLPWIVNHVFIKATIPSDVVDGPKIKVEGCKDSGNGRDSGWTHVIVKKGAFDIYLDIDISDCDGLLDQSEPLEIRVDLQTKFQPHFAFFGSSIFRHSNIPEVSNEIEFVNAYDSNTPDYNEFLEQIPLMYVQTQECIHNFMRRPFLHEDHWVGIDPGTNGSCITIGTRLGSNAENPNMVRVTALDDSNNKKEIVDSVIVIGGGLHTPASNDTEKWVPGTDYDYGLHASTRIEAYINAGGYVYRSIKKLLGYKKGGNDGRIKATINNHELQLTGVDLQYLLVKALTEKVLGNFLNRVDTEPALLGIKNRVFPDGNVDVSSFQRAVVAIPNNYQLPQILDMVESVKKNGFQEVKFIYEPEGILFHYLKQTWRNHNQAGYENIVVFDMGGATINATIFSVEYRQVNDQIHYYIGTLSRLGYAVGGDDIDYAIIEYLMHFERIASLFSNEQDRYRFQDEHKTKLVELAQDFKLKFIKMCDNLPKSGAKKPEAGQGSIPEELSSCSNMIASYLAPIVEMKDRTRTFNASHLTEAEKASYEGGNFCKSLKNHLLTSTWMQDYVYNKVMDAVLDMMDTDDVKQATDLHKIIFSGRSTMFPNIKETVLDTLRENHRAPKEYTLNGDLKSPVADGACWYGMFSNRLVFVDNSRITSSYGFRYSRPGQNDYNELIRQNACYEGRYMDELTREATIKSKFESDTGQVSFYQVMGGLHHGESIFDENNRHKVRFLTSVNLAAGQASRESITVKSSGEVLCDVDYQGKPRGQKPFTAEFDARDITKENARPYLFSVSDSEKHVHRATPFRATQTQERQTPKTEKSKDTNYFNNENRSGFRKF